MKNIIRITILLLALFFAFSAGNMLAHQNSALFGAIMIAVALVLLDKIMLKN
jgi:hypothetical protein